MEAAPIELSHEDMCAALEGVLKRVFADFDSLQSLERLSGGASQETYRIELLRANEPQVLAMRRASGGCRGRDYCCASRAGGGSPTDAGRRQRWRA